MFPASNSIVTNYSPSTDTHTPFATKPYSAFDHIFDIKWTFLYRLYVSYKLAILSLQINGLISQICPFLKYLHIRIRPDSQHIKLTERFSDPMRMIIVHMTFPLPVTINNYRYTQQNQRLSKMNTVI